MRISGGLRLAARSMLRHRLRTFLMMAGVLIGIAALTILYSIGERTRQETMARFKNMLGTFDTVMVRPGGGRRRGMPTLTNVEPSLKFEDTEAIAEIPEIKQVARLQSAFDIDVKYRNRSASPAVFGASPNWLDLRGEEISDGEFITEADDRGLARVAVIGPDASKSLFGEENPIGKTIRIAEIPFVVKGKLKSRGAGPGGASLDDLVMIPVTTASKRLFNRDYLTMAIAQLRDPLQGDAAVEKIGALLRERHHLAPGALDDFTLSNPRAVMAQVTQVGTTLTKLLTGVAVIAMLIGGIVIMSLMLIGVSERRREIGVRRSVGASRQDILLQFMLEALAVSTLGGLLGIAMGVGGTTMVAKMQQLPPAFAWSVVGWTCGLSVAIGLIFGIYPAWKAARIDPVAALRS